MLNMVPPITGFTTWSAEGHGFGFNAASVGERVRGRVKRSVIVAVIRRSEVKPLLSAIEAKSPAPNLTFWTEPVDDFGQMQSGTSITTNEIHFSGDLERAEEVS